METGKPTTDVITEGWSVISSLMTTGESPAANTTSYVSTVTANSVSTEASTQAQNATGDVLTTGGDWITKASDVIIASTTPQSYYEYSTAQFEVLLPCIFGMFVVLALSFIVFYSKHTNQYEVLEKRPSDKNNKMDSNTQHDWSTSNGLGEMNGAFSFGP